MKNLPGLPFDDIHIEELRAHPEQVPSILNALLDESLLDGDWRSLLEGVGWAVSARGGEGELSTAAREALHVVRSEIESGGPLGGQPSMAALNTLLHDFGCRITIAKLEAETDAPPAEEVEEESKIRRLA